jgi:hypothetical protein
LFAQNVFSEALALWSIFSDRRGKQMARFKPFRLEIEKIDLYVNMYYECKKGEGSWSSFRPIGPTARREDPALVSPQPPARRASGSERTMEYWVLKADDVLILFFSLCQPNIPSFYCGCSLQSQSSLTSPRGPGFQCQIKLSDCCMVIYSWGHGYRGDPHRDA